jgi:LAO/AO transport system kinase
LQHQASLEQNDRMLWMLSEKAYQLIQHRKMKGIDKKYLEEKIETVRKQSDFNLYKFISDY